jgi:hypothetical protein
MSLLADALQPFIVRELVRIGGRMNHMAIPDVIVASNAAFDLNFDNAAQLISLDFRTPEIITSVLAADCCRLSSAAFQSVASIQQEMLQRDSVAWCMVKLYYSAFYAGHTLIRLLGDACSYFDRQHVIQLDTLSKAVGRLPNFRLQTGVYHCVLDANHVTLNCTRARGVSGGAHEAFWGVFGAKIGSVSEEVLRGSSLVRADAQAVFAKLDTFKEILGRKTGFNWLSEIRNDLQYKHRLGVWYPSRINARDRQMLSGAVGNWARDPMQIDLQPGRSDTLGDFVACCIFVVALCHTLLRRVAERSSAGTRSFVLLGPLMFLNQSAN